MSFNSKELPLILGRCLLILMGFPLILRRSLVILRRCPVIIKRFPLIIRRFPFIIRRSPLMHDIILYGLCYIRIYIYIYCPVFNCPLKICFPRDACCYDNCQIPAFPDGAYMVRYVVVCV